MIDEKEKTALATSVGADERQSIQTYNTNIITTGNTEINHPDENFDEIYRQFQRMNDPAYLRPVRYYPSTQDRTRSYSRIQERRLPDY